MLKAFLVGRGAVLLFFRFDKNNVRTSSSLCGWYSLADVSMQVLQGTFYLPKCWTPKEIFFFAILALRIVKIIHFKMCPLSLCTFEPLPAPICKCSKAFKLILTKEYKNHSHQKLKGKPCIQNRGTEMLITEEKRPVSAATWGTIHVENPRRRLKCWLMRNKLIHWDKLFISVGHCSLLGIWKVQCKLCLQN